MKLTILLRNGDRRVVNMSEKVKFRADGTKLTKPQMAKKMNITARDIGGVAYKRHYVTG